MEDLKKVIEEVIEKNDKDLKNIVYEIAKKIIDLPEGTDTTIANLINYNPKEEIIDALTQGKIANIVENVCIRMNIELSSTDDSIGGLAYYNHFKKVIICSQARKKELVDKYEYYKDNIDDFI